MTEKKFCTFSWGANSYGQLSCGHKEDVLTPEKIGVSEKLNRVKTYAGGGGHTALIAGTGELLTSGWNCRGQLGLGDTEDRTILCPVEGLPPVNCIACGWNHNLAITEAGLYVWGSNTFGQLGVKKHGCQLSRPVLHQEFTHLPVVSVAAGLRHSLVALADGSVWSWGANKKGQLGLGKTDTSSASPHLVQFPQGEKVTEVAAGSHHSAAVTVSGRVYCWGSNQHGQCGRPTAPPSDRGQQSHSRPQLIGGLLSDVHVSHLKSGWSHLLAITDDRRVFTWGRADYGQLGTGDDVIKLGHCSEATEVELLRGVKQVACGAEHNMALFDSGLVLTWGWNEHGICGTGDEKNVHEPGAVPKLQDLSVFLIGCGGGHSFAATQS